MSAAPPDVEQQRTALATDKPAGSSSNDVPRLTDTWQRKSLADRYLPANRVVRYLCLGTVLAVIVFLITFLVLWFTAKPLYFGLRITSRAMQRWERDRTRVNAVFPWRFEMNVFNDNAFGVEIQDLIVTAKFTARVGHVPFGTTNNCNPACTITSLPVQARYPVAPRTYILWVGWDLADREQAAAVASLLFLCGVNATSLPSRLNNPAKLPANVSEPDAGLVQWYLDARRVSGLFGLDMTPPPDRVQNWTEVRNNKAVWAGGQSYGVPDSIMEVVCPESLAEPRGYVPPHILQLANLTRTVCEETGKCR
ncbi:hypothetical protein AMAG_16518 [Allomyces macrogynus ATCC 38327]|uniref:Uncharacterized protein n=1 Tax=Allomyces macrogynus (strain ATCC 38327) TaxID=578462 RepID=A0A0L0TD78_ALLM3|nr:hypothetical protein AMAG_16518 [Allomyces macrogynus ATCC 38327]|eukprot:KNE72474.1 hypothetical protein AMAG_16518 [Allomyces macrogynus ATCC 38327]